MARGAPLHRPGPAPDLAAAGRDRHRDRGVRRPRPAARLGAGEPPVQGAHRAAQLPGLPGVAATAWPRRPGSSRAPCSTRKCRAGPGPRRRWRASRGSPTARSRPPTRSAGSRWPTRTSRSRPGSRRSTPCLRATPSSAACRWPSSASCSTSRASQPVEASVMFSVEALTGHALRAARSAQPPGGRAADGRRPERRPFVGCRHGPGPRGMGHHRRRRARPRYLDRPLVGHG